MESSNNFWEKERLFEEAFYRGGPFFMVSSEDLPWLLFETEEDFKEGTNMVATSLRYLRLRLLNDVQMNNHLHFVLEGALQEVVIFVERLKKRMRRYLLQKGKELKQWDIQIKQIKTLTYLRYAILYVARNPYMARRDATPTGYRWGSSHLLFNDNLKEYAPGRPYSELSYSEKRDVCRSHDVDLPANYRYYNGMILRSSFVDYHRAEDFFLSANQYFQWLSRRKESDVEIARWIGESILLPNEDVFRIVSDWYKVKAITTLTPNQRLEAAGRMKAELNSNNKQIAHPPGDCSRYLRYPERPCQDVRPSVPGRRAPHDHLRRSQRASAPCGYLHQAWR